MSTVHRWVLCNLGRAVLALLLLGTLLLSNACAARMDVKRNGDIKLRGESPVKMRGKDPGDLLQKGIASWYGHPYHGRKTSNGETYNMNAMTAAHKTIPFDTMVKVVDIETGRSTIVRINDRGPFIRGRVIDLSRAAAQELGIENKGTTHVRLYLAKPKEIRRAGRDKPRGSEESSKPKPQTTSKPKPQTTPKTEPKPKVEEKPRPVVEDIPDIILHPDQPDEGIEEEILEPEDGSSLPEARDPGPLNPWQGSFWTVQVGSFSTRERAEQMAIRLRAYTKAIFVVPSETGFRVRAGRYASKEEAQDFAALLKADGLATWVTRHTP